MIRDEIAIVGYGALLPEADHAGAFWRNLLAGRCSIREIPASLWLKQLYYSPDPEARDHSHSAFAGFVDDASLDAAARRLGVSRKDHNRLQIMTLAAASQALAPLQLKRSAAGRSAVYLGCMAVDEGLAGRKFIAHEWDSLAAHVARTCPDQREPILHALEEHLSRWYVDPDRDRPLLFTSSVLSLLRQRFGLDGEAALVDAACASSLAAFDLALRALRSHQADLVLAGGIDANLAPSTFVLFSRLGALARERCLPLDRRSEGLSQGEGAVVFVLERLADARRLGHPVHGVLKACGASSDGTRSSLFAPTAEGQLRAYAQAYRDLDASAVDYIECHATGTAVGDETELRSVIRFFGDRDLPLGSVKAQLGHTKGAAGAVSLLKCLLSLQHRALPPSPYFRESVLAERHGPYVNTAPLRLREDGAPLTFGISSFGFGGINYHLVLQEVRNDLAPVPSAPAARQPHEIVLIGRRFCATAGIRQAENLPTLRIPPRSLEQIDAVQLAALLATVEAVAAYRIDFQRLERSAVSVIAASTLGLERSCSVSNRVLHFELKQALAHLPKATVEKIMAHKEHLPPVTEDSGPGSLNNVIAGRVANHFDLTGATFNIDADLASFPAALRAAEQILATSGGLVILLAVDEHYDRARFRIGRAGVTCWLLAALEFAKAQRLPIQARLGGISYAAEGEQG